MKRISATLLALLLGGSLALAQEDKVKIESKSKNGKFEDKVEMKDGKAKYKEKTKGKVHSDGSVTSKTKVKEKNMPTTTPPPQ